MVIQITLISGINYLNLFYEFKKNNIYIVRLIDLVGKPDSNQSNALELDGVEYSENQNLIVWELVALENLNLKLFGNYFSFKLISDIFQI